LLFWAALSIADVPNTAKEERKKARRGQGQRSRNCLGTIGISNKFLFILG
jgi:hypothetical protein